MNMLVPLRSLSVRQTFNVGICGGGAVLAGERCQGQLGGKEVIENWFPRLAPARTTILMMTELL
jgi:hypothetical protein